MDNNQTPIAPETQQPETPPVQNTPTEQQSHGTSSVPPSTPTQNPKSRNWKKWIFIGGIILVILLTGTAYVLSQQESKKTKPPTKQPVSKPTPTPDPTADWKTYTNTKYGYSLKYPQKWDISALNDYLENPNPQFPDAGAIQSICTGPNSCPFNINIFKDSLENKLSEFTKTLTNQDPTFIISTTDISNNGIAGKKIITKGSQPGTPGYHHLYAKNEYVYIIDATDIAGSKLSEEIYPQTLQILKSFKFAEQAPVSRVPKTACEQSGGKWLAKYNECEASSGGLDEKTCKELGGVHKACDSACRHDPNAQGCIEVCINVCKF
jgi:hypothetical protein